jgi:segregation and condensation protein B
MTSITQHIEALLFTAGEAVTISDLKQLLGVSEEDIKESLQELSQSLEHHGLSLIITDRHAQLVTGEVTAEFLSQFMQEGENELSKAAMETLSVIAYRGPITRYDVDTIRGVDSRRMIRQLLLRGLLQQIRTAGQASKYDISEDALMKLGITKKQDLPEFSSLSLSQHIDRLLKEEK